VRKYVFSVYHMPETQYLLPNWKWNQAAPCTNDTSYTHKVLQGQVSDGNAYAMGGIAGHAGIFSTAGDVAQLAARMLFPETFAPVQQMLNETTIALFTTEYNHTQSSRALGWDTNDPDVSDYGFSQACGGWSKQTFLHVGYEPACQQPRGGSHTDRSTDGNCVAGPQIHWHADLLRSSGQGVYDLPHEPPLSVLVQQPDAQVPPRLQQRRDRSVELQRLAQDASHAAVPSDAAIALKLAASTH